MITYYCKTIVNLNFKLNPLFKIWKLIKVWRVHCAQTRCPYGNSHNLIKSLVRIWMAEFKYGCPFIWREGAEWLRSTGQGERLTQPISVCICLSKCWWLLQSVLNWIGENTILVVSTLLVGLLAWSRFLRLVPSSKFPFVLKSASVDVVESSF